ncbi:MAG: hypothetical protein N2037_09475 [Acidimicrobiales bacterium]|nr:hypothetical protein [Acidimicrobiales bacterium]
MPPASNPELLVLLSLRLKSVAVTRVLAEHAGLPEPDVAELLARLGTEGLVRCRQGSLTGWSLLPAGRIRGEALLAAELDSTGSREVVGAAYHRFLALNAELLRVCTDWQVRTDIDDHTLNDHSDAAYDEQVISRLGQVHQQVVPVIAELSEVLDRFSGYAPRLSEALERVTNGELDWFARPLVDSYHTVWFELHENLLATLGIERASEPRAELSG